MPVQKQASTHAVFTYECAIVITGIILSIFLKPGVLRNSSSCAAQLLCVSTHRTAPKFVTAMMRARLALAVVSLVEQAARSSAETQVRPRRR